jgi:hypothetical protein
LQDSNPTDTPQHEQALVELTLESWRFARLFSRLADKLGDTEATRYRSQQRYFLKRLEETLQAIGWHLVNLENQPYDPGQAVNPLNLGDFGPDDNLQIEHMVEPIIMKPDGLLRTGTVTLRKTAS